MKILNKTEELKKPDKSYVEGLVLMGEYSENPTKNGGSYLAGNLQALGDVSFKVWSGACFNDMVKNSYTGKVVKIEGTVNEYGGVKSLILDAIYDVPTEELDKEGISEIDFFSTKYDTESYYARLTKKLQKCVSAEAYQVYNLIMGDYLDKFKNEFAAINYHDNCRGGLLAHTTKVVNICSVITMYPNISSRISIDALCVGAALHDLGKTLEYCNGTISEVGKYISHNTFGVLILNEHKEEIIHLKGEEFYNILLSIVSQHHGEYGERPRTIAAYIVHQFDLLDSSLTLLDQTLEDTPTGQVRFDGLKLI